MNKRLRTEKKQSGMKVTLVLGILLSVFFMTSCGGEGGDDDPTPEKTLNKELLYNKKWKNDAGHIHEFKDAGLYAFEGTWEWLNGSDSMAIKATKTSSLVVWYFDWSSETEMQCRRGKEGGERLYKVVP